MGNIIPQVSVDTLPLGEYPAVISESMLDDGQFGEQVKLTFDLEGEHDGRQLWGWASARFTPRSKLYKWAGASIWAGKAIPENYDLDIDHFLNRRVILRVVIKQKEDGTEINKIDSLVPLPQEDDPAAVIPAAQPIPVAPAPF